MKNLAFLLIAVGAILLGYWAYEYSENNKTAGIGDLKISVSQSTSPVPAVVGGIGIVAGILMIARGKRQ